jgi:hypothetical protein
MLFALVVGLIVHGSRGETLAATGGACIVAGVAAALAAAGIGAANDEIRSKGDCFRAAEAIVTRNRNLLFDNPVLSSSDLVRRALLPTDGELAAFRFSQSMAAMLREFREGRGYLMAGGSRSGTRYFLARPSLNALTNNTAMTPSHQQPEVEG